MDRQHGACYALSWRRRSSTVLERLDARPAETVLTHGAAGGVGTTAVQQARHRGARRHQANQQPAATVRHPRFADGAPWAQLAAQRACSDDEHDADIGTSLTTPGPQGRRCHRGASGRWIAAAAVRAPSHGAADAHRRHRCRRARDPADAGEPVVRPLLRHAAWGSWVRRPEPAAPAHPWHDRARPAQRRRR